ncbi:MAG: uroporphyrinogen-III synthase [Ignavibacteria bacterium]|nr:uroporphyrinogen-III synthase [Ignavibacteria bacterium]
MASNPVVRKPFVISFRAESESDETLELFQKHGFDGRNIPLIRMTPVINDSSVDAIARTGEFEIIIFTSVHALYSTVQIMDKLGISLSDFKSLSIACVGEKTAKKVLEYFPENEVIIPATFTADGLVDFLSKASIGNKKILLPVGNLSKESLADNLEALGAEVEKVIVYKNDPPLQDEYQSIREYLTHFAPDYLIFTSPSTFKNFLRVFGEFADQALKVYPACAIGDVTAEVIEKSGYPVFLVPSVYTLETLLIELKNKISENKF